MLDNLKLVNKIGPFAIRRVCEDMGIPIPNYLSFGPPIVIDHDINMIAFRIGDGSCGAKELIEVAKLLSPDKDVIDNCAECSKPPEKVQITVALKHTKVWVCNDCIDKAHYAIHSLDPEDFGEELPMGTLLKEF